MNYDVAIIGGGLAGLSLSIDLRKKGYNVVVIEKGNYPRHKVCGEYISLESRDHLYSICPALTSLSLPLITRFRLSSTGKPEFNGALDLGGFGISRFLLEDLLFTEAKNQGVVFMLKCKALEIPAEENENGYTVKTNQGPVHAMLVCNASGRRSNFEARNREELPVAVNYIGIKYHVKLQRDPGIVEIHNFPGGYCGVSGIEDNKTCLCYLVNSKKLNSVQNSIPELEKVFLFKNAHLKKIFESAEFLFNDPLAVSGINFRIKDTVNDCSIFLGDAAGSIAPLTGNGMSMAIRSAAELATLIHNYFSGGLTKTKMIECYTHFWNKEFASRVRSSRHIQKLAEYPGFTNLMIRLFNPFPFLAKTMMKQTHGAPF